MDKLRRPAIDPAEVPLVRVANYPEPFASRITGRVKRRIGDALGLKNFGVNLTLLEPGASSALRHWHTRQGEFIYVLEGELVLVTGGGEQVLVPGTAADFPAGDTDGHQLVNRTDRCALYLEVGERLPGDIVHYPDDDLAVRPKPAGWIYSGKDGVSY